MDTYQIFQAGYPLTRYESTPPSQPLNPSMDTVNGLHVAGRTLDLFLQKHIGSHIDALIQHCVGHPSSFERQICELLNSWPVDNKAFTSEQLKGLRKGLTKKYGKIIHYALKPTAVLQRDALMCIIRTSMSFPFLLQVCIGQDVVDSDLTLANLGRSTFGRRTSKFWDLNDFRRMMRSRENILTSEDSILICKLHVLALASVRAIFGHSDIGQMVRRSNVPSYKNIPAKIEIPLTDFQYILDLVSHVQSEEDSIFTKDFAIASSNSVSTNHLTISNFPNFLFKKLIIYAHVRRALSTIILSTTRAGGSASIIQVEDMSSFAVELSTALAKLAIEDTFTAFYFVPSVISTASGGNEVRSDRDIFSAAKATHALDMAIQSYVREHFPGAIQDHGLRAVTQESTALKSIQYYLGKLRDSLALFSRNAIRPCLILAYILCSDILYGNTVKRMKLENELSQGNRLGHLFIESLDPTDPDKQNELVLKEACKDIIGA